MIKTALAAIVVSAGLGLPAPASASAAPPAPKCAMGYICFWPKANFQGKMTSYGNPSWHTCGYTPSGTVRSVVNNDNEAWALYQSSNCTMRVSRIPAGARKANIGFDARTWG